MSIDPLIFRSLDEFQRHLNQDAGQLDRFISRFILVEGLANWRELINFLKLQVQETISLAAFCQGADTLPRLPSEVLKASIFKNQEHRTVILPLAEVVRLHEDHGGRILRELAILESVGRSRCYIPLWQAQDLFYRLMQTVSRWQDETLPAPWLIAGGRDEILVMLTPWEVQVPADYQKVQGLRAYLQMWEKGGPSTPHIALASGLAAVAQSSFQGGVTLQVYRDGYEIVSRKLPGAEQWQKECGSEHHWQWLASVAVLGESFSATAGRLLNVQTYKYPEIFQDWLAWPEEKKWLLWLWSKLILPGEYAKAVLERSKSYQDFPEDCWTGILRNDIPWEDDILRERRRLLKHFQLTDPPAAFWRQYETLPDSLKKLKALTDLTQREKQEAIRLTARLLKEQQPWEIIVAALDLVYPELAWYLAPLSINEPKLDQYFREYKTSRILDEPTAKLRDLAQELAHQGYLHQFSTRHAALEKIRREGIPEVWIDGMGVEWLGFIEHYCREHQVQVEITISQANLPSITSTNKDWREHGTIIRDLDNYAHRKDYQYPQSLVEELEIIEKHLRNTIGLLERFPQVILTSDHGLSRYTFHRSKGLTPPEGAEVDKWGRCARIRGVTPEIAARTDWRMAGGYLCLTGYGRFQGGSGAVGEVHGGANLEEALVPVLVLRRFAGDDRLEYTIQLMVPTVRFDINRRGVLREVWIDPDPGTLQLHTWDYRVVVGQRVGPGRYEFALTNLRPGDFQVRFEAEGRIIGAATIKVRSAGLEEEEMGI